MSPRFCLALSCANNAPGDRVPLAAQIHSRAHIAGFVDVGTVEHDWQDIDPNHVRAYGIGLRGGSDENTSFRFDVAHGDGGTRVFLKFTPSF